MVLNVRFRGKEWRNSRPRNGPNLMEAKILLIFRNDPLASGTSIG
jgi:hypothetical protein